MLNTSYTNHNAMAMASWWQRNLQVEGEATTNERQGCEDASTTGDLQRGGKGNDENSETNGKRGGRWATLMDSVYYYRRVWEFERERVRCECLGLDFNFLGFCCCGCWLVYIFNLSNFFIFILLEEHIGLWVRIDIEWKRIWINRFFNLWYVGFLFLESNRTEKKSI